MLERAKEIIDDISKQTDEVLLFHSLSGKDSIVLTDLCSPKFKRVLCCFMYIVKDLEHINKYYSYFKSKYPNVEFVQVPHYAYYNYIKYGFMGMRRNPKQREWTLAQITDKVRERSGIEWACYGFKQECGDKEIHREEQPEESGNIRRHKPVMWNGHHFAGVPLFSEDELS